MSTNNDTQPQSQCNPRIDTVSVDVVIEAELIRLSPIDLLSNDFEQTFLQRIAAASSVEFPAWNLVAELPDGPRRIILEFATCDGPQQRRFGIRGSQESFIDAFTATPSLPLTSRNLSHCARLVAFAIAAASRCHPEMRMQAAEQIRDWQRSHGVHAESVPSIARQIRGVTDVSEDNSRNSPQGAANLVLATLQDERVNRGEDPSLSPPVRYFHGHFYFWDGTKWMKTEQFDLRTTRVLQRELPSTYLTTSFLGSVVQNIKALTSLNIGEFQLPVWVSREQTEITPVQRLSFTNGVVNVNELSSGRQSPTLQRHDPRVCGAPFLPYAYDPLARCPLWQQTIQEIFPLHGEADRRQHIVQEFFGYCLLPWNHTLEKFAILLGSGANGKSVLLNVLRHMLGSENVSAVPLDALSSEFRPAAMIANLRTPRPTCNGCRECKKGC